MPHPSRKSEAALDALGFQSLRALKKGYRVSDVVELRETTSCWQSDTLADACKKLCQSGRTAVVVLTSSQPDTKFGGEAV